VGLRKSGRNRPVKAGYYALVEERTTQQRMRETAQRRVRDTARQARERAQCARLDMPWARWAPARLMRETILQGFFAPVMAWYVHRDIDGREVFEGLRRPVIFVANHSSHMDTPTILRTLPRAWRQRTAVAAAADYFYRKRWVAVAVSLLFNTVPIQRRGGGMGEGSADHLHRLLRQRWNLLLYPEGTRSRDGARGRLHSGAAVLAAAHDVPIVPIFVSGTRAAMPPGRGWPRRLRDGLFWRRHRIFVRFGPPIRAVPGEHRRETIARVQAWFDAQEGRVPPAAQAPPAPPARADERRMPVAGHR
jgi:1-acyl-sn-glycerol-3-phosphate acyltransferase